MSSGPTKSDAIQATATDEPAPGPETADVPDAPHIICLGASAGGLEALEAFIAAIPPQTSAAFVVIAHLSPDFKSLMPELLGRHTCMTVTTAADQAIPVAGSIYIIPPAQNIIYQGNRLVLEPQDRKPGHILHLPIDIFLSSLAQSAPHRSIGVILSGTGSDGTRGARALKDAGGVVLAQDLASAKFDGMPRSAIDSGAVDSVGPPADLAQIAAEIVKSGGIPGFVGDEDVEDSTDDVLAVQDAVRIQLNMDISHLRAPMLRRRYRRRMALLGISGSSVVDPLSLAGAFNRSRGLPC